MTAQRRALVALATTALVAGSLIVPSVSTSAAPAAATTDTYLVLASDTSSVAAAHAAVTASGGQVVGEIDEIGAVIATSDRSDFVATADAQAGVAGVASNRVVGTLPKIDAVDAESRAEADSAAAAVRDDRHRDPQDEPLADLQWDMRLIGATPQGSYGEQPGRKGVLIGVLDSGIDGNHPDIAPNFNEDLSRNFVTDIPSLDGPCEYPSCVDPVNEDDDGHGTHVAGEIGAPINGVGMAGVAPNVTLVNIRVGQDAGFIFLEPAVKALVYAGEIGVDVINMSFFIDPWLFNCQANPADSATEQAEQRTIVAATQRAINFAHRRGVTMVAALGNEHSDIGLPVMTDTISPDYPLGTEKTRTIDNATCLTMPTEANHVIAVASVGPSTRKADYSNYGLEQNDVSAPGGWFRDGLGTATFRTPGNEVLGPMPHNVALLSGAVDLTSGESLSPFVIAQCSAPGPDNSAYWQYLQGTSMASPHAAGVAALIVSEFGHRDRRHGGLTMDPDKVEKILRRTATATPCPAVNPISYVNVGRDPSFDALCVVDAANPDRNSIYGDGIVSAINAIQGGHHEHDD